MAREITVQQLDARCEAGFRHLDAGRLDQAERVFSELTAASPQYARAYHGLGDVALRAGVYASALRFLEVAVALDQTAGRAWASMGMTLRSLGRDADGLIALQRAVETAPDYAIGHYWLGIALLEVGEGERARAALARAMELSPDLIGPFGTTLYRYFETCNWRDWREMSEFMRAALEGPRPLFTPMNLMLLTSSAAELQTCARQLASAYFPARPPMAPAAHAPGDRIRIAYVSTDLNDHPVGHLMAGVLEAHDRGAFEVTAVNFGSARPGDPVRARLAAACDRFLDLEGAGDAAIAQAIFDSRIDVAIDLNGYTTHCLPEIFARRPAPVQVNFLGFPGTMGAPYMDYIIADPHVIPRGAEGFYDENVVRMPHSYQPTDSKARIAAGTPTRASQGLPDEALVFMAYNRNHKISPAIFDVWMRILFRIPGSVLWLQDGGESARTNLRREAASRGVAPDRLVFAARNLPRPDHLARHRLADLFLDSLPYNAHSTASDALFAGLPVLTCRGSTFPGRVCASLVSSAGFAELVTDSLAEYEELAVILAGDRPRLAALRERVAREAPASPLFDTAGYTRHLESAFRVMVDKSRKGEAPAGFAVAGPG